MVRFEFPVKVERGLGREVFGFAVATHPVLLAGSRYREMPSEAWQLLIQQFNHLGFHFYVGCARGVDRCFRNALAASPYHNDCYVACVFPSRLRQSRFLGAKAPAWCSAPL